MAPDQSQLNAYWYLLYLLFLFAAHNILFFSKGFFGNTDFLMNLFNRTVY